MTPAGQILIEAILPQVQNVALPMLAVTAVALWMMGRASLRMLEEAHEEIPHRAEMRWGARWYWAVMAAGLALPIAAMLAALTRTAWPVTVAVLGALSIGPIGYALHRLTPWQLQGQFLWLTARTRKDDETLREAMQRQCRRECAGWAKWLQGGIVAVYVGMMIWAGNTTIPLDQRLMQFDRADRLGAQIAERIGSSEVVNAHVIFDGMLSRLPGNRVLIEVEAETSEQEVAEIADAAEPHVRALLPAGEWTIRAWSEGGGELERLVVNPKSRADDI